VNVADSLWITFKTSQLKRNIPMHKYDA
jgi:hypothetical protein